MEKYYGIEGTQVVHLPENAPYEESRFNGRVKYKGIVIVPYDIEFALHPNVEQRREKVVDGIYLNSYFRNVARKDLVAALEAARIETMACFFSYLKHHVREGYGKGFRFVYKDNTLLIDGKVTLVLGEDRHVLVAKGSGKELYAMDAELPDRIFSLPKLGEELEPFWHSLWLLKKKLGKREYSKVQIVEYNSDAPKKEDVLVVG